MKIAAFQRFPLYDDLDRVCEVVGRDLRWAAAHGIDLALFPEGFLLGHSYDADVIVARARSVSSGALDVLCRRTRQAIPTYVIGAFERQGAGIVNSAIVIAGGEVIGRSTKAHPNEPLVTAGTESPVYDHHGCDTASAFAMTRTIPTRRSDLPTSPLR